MKITIAHLPGEEREADVIKRAICCTLGKVKVKESDRHAPYRHIYIATKKQPDTPCKKENNVV